MSVLDRARALGGREAYPEQTTMDLLPAARVIEFMRAEIGLGNAVDFVECLYLYVGGGLSRAWTRDRADFTNDEDFVSFTDGAAQTALKRADAKRANAYFEVGVTERL